MGMRQNNETFTTNRLKAARRLTGPGKFPLWPLTSYSHQHSLGISMLTRPNHKPQVKFTLTLMNDRGVLSPLIRGDVSRQRDRGVSIWSFLKGLWGTSGSLYFPKNGYYLSLSAKVPSKILQSTKLSWLAHKNALNLRNHDDITTFLYNTGMERSALEFEELSIIRSARNRANLVSNYDTANIARTVRASSVQRELAEKIISLGIFSNLPDKLREIVELRLNYPDETLEGLGQKTNPPVSKSTVKYRWKRLESLLSTGMNN